MPLSMIEFEGMPLGPCKRAAIGDAAADDHGFEVRAIPLVGQHFHGLKAPV